MGIQELAAAFTARDWEEQREQLIGGLIHFIPAATDPQTVDPRELAASGGAVAPIVAWQEKFWWRDEESTADHDEITVITLLDGTNYVTNDIVFPPVVQSRTLSAEPDEDSSPAVEYGLAWRIPEGATGDEWPDHENEVALWTARGWRYRPGNIGDLHYILDEEGYEHFNADEEWEDGIGAFAIQAGSVQPDDLLIPAGWQFENQTTTAPPATGPAGETYIIGPAATGAWSGHDGKIAWRPALDTAFVIRTPNVGEIGYDKNLGIRVSWNGSAWVSAAGSLVGFKASTLAEDGAFSQFGASADYGYSAGTAPTKAGGTERGAQSAGLAYAVKAVGNKLRIRARGVIGATTTNTWAAIFRDLENAAIDWTAKIGAVGDTFDVSFIVTPADTNSHTYYFALGRGSGESANVTRFQMTIEELIES